MRKPKNQLVRVVRLPDGSITIDKTGKLSGRGAYLCPGLTCYNKARKAKRFETNLETEIPAQVYETLASMLAEEQEVKDEPASE